MPVTSTLLGLTQWYQPLPTKEEGYQPTGYYHHSRLKMNFIFPSSPEYKNLKGNEKIEAYNRARGYNRRLRILLTDDQKESIQLPNKGWDNVERLHYQLSTLLGNRLPTSYEALISLTTPSVKFFELQKLLRNQFKQLPQGDQEELLSKGIKFNSYRNLVIAKELIKELSK